LNAYQRVAGRIVFGARTRWWRHYSMAAAIAELAG
jgi:hypothetical protein